MALQSGVKWFLTLNGNWLPYTFQPFFLGCPPGRPTGRHFWAYIFNSQYKRPSKHGIQLNWEGGPESNTTWSTIYLIINTIFTASLSQNVNTRFSLLESDFLNGAPWATYTVHKSSCSWYVGKMESCCGMWSLSNHTLAFQGSMIEYCCDKDSFPIQSWSWVFWGGSEFRLC